MNEKEAIRKSIKGDHKAFKQLVLKYGPKLLTTCRLYTPTSIPAEDILQEAFIKIYTRLHKYDSDKGSFLSYCSRICINTAFSQRDKIKSRSEAKLRILNDYDDVILPKAIHDLEAEDVIKLLQKLPIRYADVFNLYVVEGYDHNEIANLLNIAPSSSRVFLKRAKSHLQELIISSESKLRRDGSI